MEHELRALVMDHGDIVVIQALELDIAAQGASFDEAAERFDTAVRAELLHCANTKIDPNSSIGPAPQHFFNVWESCSEDDSLSNDYLMRRCAA